MLEDWSLSHIFYDFRMYMLAHVYIVYVCTYMCTQFCTCVKFTVCKQVLLLLTVFASHMHTLCGA